MTEYVIKSFMKGKNKSLSFSIHECAEGWLALRLMSSFMLFGFSLSTAEVEKIQPWSE